MTLIERLKLYKACEDDDLETVKKYELIRGELRILIRISCECGSIKTFDYFYNLLISKQYGHTFKTDVNNWFILAIKSNQLSIVKYIINDPCNKLKNSYIIDGFNLACGCNDVDLAKLLVEQTGYKNPANILVPNAIGYMFEVACENGYLDIAKLLLSIGDKSINDSVINMAFAKACKTGKVHIMEWIYSIRFNYKKFRINYRNWGGYSLAFRHGHMDAFNWINDHDDTENPDEKIIVAFKFLCKNVYLEQAKLFLKKYSDVLSVHHIMK